MENNINSSRILAKGYMQKNNTWKTFLNNNDLIIGPSGAGKTRGYVKPNILQANESMIIADTKGNLRKEFSEYLKMQGYAVYDINLTDVKNSSSGYNPLDYVRYDEKTDKYNEQDVRRIALAVCPDQDKSEPVWDNSARLYMECLIGYVLECLPLEQHTMYYVGKLFEIMGSKKFDQLYEELGLENPNSFVYSRYQMAKQSRNADKMDASIKGFVGNQLRNFVFDGCESFYSGPHKITFSDIGKRKTAVFLTISDIDRSQDNLANLFYTQALYALFYSADHEYEDSRLPVPVRFIFDDFATNTVIPNFDNIISEIRSREIYASIIVQSLSQLEGLYGKSKASTIIDNCDHCLYLGGQDVETATYLAVKADKRPITILNLPLNRALLFARGSKVKEVEKYDVTKHPAYKLIASNACKKLELTNKSHMKDEPYA